MKNNLKNIRKQKGLRQEAIAELTGFSISQISRWETSKSNIPSDKLPILTEAYGCNVKDVFGDLESHDNSRLKSNVTIVRSDNKMSIRARIEQSIIDTPEMTNRKLSLMAGLSDSMMHKFMTSSTQSMSIDKLIAVADVLNVDPRWLIFGEEALPNELVKIWNKITEAEKPRALAVLRAFAEKESDIEDLLRIMDERKRRQALVIIKSLAES